MNNTVNDSAIKKLKLLFTVVDRPKAEFYLEANPPEEARNNRKRKHRLPWRCFLRYGAVSRVLS